MFPKSEFLVENLNSESYLLSTPKKIKDFSDEIDKINKSDSNFTLGIALDIPQLLQSRKFRNTDFYGSEIENLFEELMASRDNIISIHLWGARGGEQDGGKGE